MIVVKIEFGGADIAGIHNVHITIVKHWEVLGSYDEILLQIYL